MDFDASARLFLDNPTMDGTAKLAPAFVGRDSLRYRLPSAKIIIRFQLLNLHN